MFVSTILLSFFSTAQIDSASEVKLLRLAKKYRYGINTDVCMRKAISIYKALANKGNVVGMRELGYIYLNGDSVKKVIVKHMVFSLRLQIMVTRNLCVLWLICIERERVCRWITISLFHCIEKQLN